MLSAMRQAPEQWLTCEEYPATHDDRNNCGLFSSGVLDRLPYKAFTDLPAQPRKLYHPDKWFLMHDNSRMIGDTVIKIDDVVVDQSYASGRDAFADRLPLGTTV